MTVPLANLLAKGVRADNGCLLVPGNPASYPMTKRGGHFRVISRIILEERLGRELEPLELACHSCDTPRCIEPSHIWLGSHAENSQDMVAKGRQRGGPKALGHHTRARRGLTVNALILVLLAASMAASQPKAPK